MVTLESETVITNARNLYDALPDSAKAYVTNIDVLITAEAVLAQLKTGQVPVEQPQAQPEQVQPEQVQAQPEQVQPEQPQ